MIFQIVSLFVLVSLPHSITPIDPGTSLDAFGTHISTLGLVTRLEQVLSSGGNSTRGNLIHYKAKCKSSSKCQCLNAAQDWIVKANGYGFSLAECNSASALQQWKLIGEQFLVGAPGDLPDINERRQACADCWSATDDCFMHIFACYNNNKHQQFFIRIHARQLNLVKKEVFFSIHLKANPSKCISSYYDSDSRRQAFRMSECQGSEQQSFQVDGDFSDEIKLLIDD